MNGGLGIWLGVGLGLGGVVLPAYSTPYPSLTGSVSVCDPNEPTNCLVPGSGSGGISVTPTPLVGTYTDHSGTGTGSNVVVIPANPARKQLLIGNPTTNSNSIYLNFGAAAAAGSSVELVPGGWYNSLGGPVSGSSVNIRATAAELFIAKEM